MGDDSESPDEEMQIEDMSRDELGEYMVLAAGDGEPSDLEAITEILKHDATVVDWQDEDGKTAMHMAAAEGHTEVVNLLLKNKAKPSLGNSNDNT
eukprot:gene15695-4728_t